MPLLLSDREQITEIARFIPPAAWLLIYNFFPGALTIILPKSKAVPDVITGGGTSVAIRIPQHPVPLALIRGLGKPVVGTSANLSGHASPLTAEEVRNQLGNKVDLIIDGGKCPGGVASTVVDLSVSKPVIRRPGAIKLEELQQTYESDDAGVAPQDAF